MKKWLSVILVAILLCTTLYSAVAEEEMYKIGDKIEDFQVTVSDGTEVSLYGLLAEKKAVLVNIWASWCGLCKMEFPYMSQAYAEMSDEIGIIALSKEAGDTDETILELKKELGVENLPMGRDTVGLADKLTEGTIPTSIMVDRNGVICFMEQRAITDAREFMRLFSMFTGDTYTDPIYVYEIPQAMPQVKAPTAEELSEVLGTADDRIQVTNVDMPTWPFAIAASGEWAVASNGQDKGTVASFGLTVQAQAGEKLGYTYTVDCQPGLNSLRVLVNNQLARTHAGHVEEAQDYVTFDTAGECEIIFLYSHGEDKQATTAALRAVRWIPDAEAQAIEAARFVGPAKTLEGKECTVELVEGQIRAAAFTENGVPTQDNAGIGILQGDSATFKIKVGSEINDDLAYVQCGTTYTMLKDLEQVEDGYLCTYTHSNMPTALPTTSTVLVYASIDDAEAECVGQSELVWFDQESDLDVMVEGIQVMYRTQGIDFAGDWSYMDGAPRLTEKISYVSEQAAQPTTGKYIVMVTDKAGQPLEGVIIQLCDATTCQMLTTDAEGMMTYEGTPYAYEIHVLKAPAGYARTTEAFVFPQEGGSISIMLDAE